VPEADAEESIRSLAMAILPDCDDDWLRLERDRLRDLFLHAIEAHAARLSAAGHYARAWRRHTPPSRRIQCERLPPQP